MDNETMKIKVRHLPKVGLIILERHRKDNFFVSNDTQFMISKSNLYLTLRCLLDSGIISERFLQGILEEYNTA